MDALAVAWVVAEGLVLMDVLIHAMVVVLELVKVVVAGVVLMDVLDHVALCLIDF